MKSFLTWGCWTLTAVAVIAALSLIDPKTLTDKPLLVPGLLLISLGVFIEARKHVRKPATASRRV
jgi:uncharacterized membrane protein